MTLPSHRMRFHIRPAVRRDIVAVDALLARSYPVLLKPDYPPSVLVTAVPLISRAQAALVTCGTYYVAETEDGRIVGAGGWTRRNPARGASQPADTGNIRHFATDPDAVRKGIGAAVLLHCLDQARAAGMRRMLCYSTRTAVPFYAAYGFVAHAEIEIELRAGIRFPAVQMEAPLGDAA